MIVIISALINRPMNKGDEIRSNRYTPIIEITIGILTAIPPPLGVGSVCELLSLGISITAFFTAYSLTNEVIPSENKNVTRKQPLKTSNIILLS